MALFNRRRLVLAGMSAVLAAIFTTPVAARAPQIQAVLDLAPGAADGSSATFINEAGMVAGSRFANGQSHAFVWTKDAGMVDLTPEYALSQVSDLNEKGAVAGDGYVSDYRLTRAFVWTPGDGRIDIGTLGGNSSAAEAINEHGVIVGASRTAQGASHAFVWTRGQGMIDLGTLGGNSSGATAINDRGMVVGWSNTVGSGGNHAFLWTRESGMVDLGTGTLEVWTEATAINERGLVVGRGRNKLSDYHAFVWTPETGMVELGVPRLDSEVSAINEHGVVVVNSGTNDYDPVKGSFVWTQADGQRSLDPPGSSGSWAFDVNEAGTIVGMVFRTSGMSPFVWTPGGGMIDLGPQGLTYSMGWKVNERGMVMGFRSAGLAFAWTPDTGVIDLPSLGGDSRSAANAINDRGMIAGQSKTSGDGPVHATLWQIPEGPPREGVYLNADGYADAFQYDSATGHWSRQLGQPGGGFVEESQGQWQPGWSVLPANFDGNGLTDFFLFNPVTGAWAKMLNDEVTKDFTVQSSGSWWPGWQRFVMDLDGDTISDLFLYDPGAGQWFKCVSTPSGFAYLQGAWSPDWEITPMPLNDDSLGDMFLLHRATGRWFWVLGQAGSGFAYPKTGVK